MSRLAPVRTWPTERKFCSILIRRGVPGARPLRSCARRPREPLIELGEGGEAGAPEAVDRLVVVAHDHHVVGPVRRATEELDELDLGDVGVLELVDEDVPELALPAAQDVGLGPEQPGDEGDLLAEVEGAAPGELGLVRVVDAGELAQPDDLERRRVAHVVVGQLVDLRQVLGREPTRPVRLPIAGDRPPRLAIGDLVQPRAVEVGPGALARPEVGVPGADLAQRPEVALGLEPDLGLGEAPVSGLEHVLLGLDEPVEVLGRDQLVLRPVDELDEARKRPIRVVAKPELARRSWSRSIWPTPSSTSGLAGSPASAADSVRTRWQKLWKLLTDIRERVATPTASSIRVASSAAAFTLYVSTRICSGRRSSFVSSSHRTRSTMTRVFPVPAPAITTTGPSPASTIARCSGVSATRSAIIVTCPLPAQYRYSEATKGTRLYISRPIGSVMISTISSQPMPITIADAHQPTNTNHTPRTIHGCCATGTWTRLREAGLIDHLLDLAGPRPERDHGRDAVDQPDPERQPDDRDHREPGDRRDDPGQPPADEDEPQRAHQQPRPLLDLVGHGAGAYGTGALGGGALGGWLGGAPGGVPGAGGAVGRRTRSVGGSDSGSVNGVPRSTSTAWLSPHPVTSCTSHHADRRATLPVTGGALAHHESGPAWSADEVAMATIPPSAGKTTRRDTCRPGSPATRASACGSAISPSSSSCCVCSAGRHRSHDGNRRSRSGDPMALYDDQRVEIVVDLSDDTIVSAWITRVER